MIGRISRLAREIEARLEPVYREHGLEPGWHDVLATLRRSGGSLRPTDLTKASMLTSSGTTKRLDKLEQAGLIVREPDPGDRRGTLISLTAEGRRLIDRLTPAHLANERRILSGLSEAEQRRLAELLRRLQLRLPVSRRPSAGRPEEAGGRSSSVLVFAKWEVSPSCRAAGA